MKQKVLFIGDLNKELDSYKAFSNKYECIHYEVTTEEQLIQDFQTKFSDVVAIYGAWLGLHLIGGFRNRVLENAPKSLKVIAICSVGHDGYDGEAMAKRGMILTNVPAIGAAGPVAELVLYNTLASFRNFHFYTKDFVEIQHTLKSRKGLEVGTLDSNTGKITINNREGYSFGEYALQRGNLSPAGHNAVIVGFGRLGKEIAKRLAAIGMNIHYIKRSPMTPQDAQSLSFKAVFHKTLDEVTEIADLIVIACPGTSETRHMINAGLIASFKRPMRIINIGRGSIIDEASLVEGLESGKILFAGLDVFEQEPKIHPGLIGRSDVVLTPHIGASTVENFDFTATSALDNIDSALSGNFEELNRVN